MEYPTNQELSVLQPLTNYDYLLPVKHTSPSRKPKTKAISKNKGHHKHQAYLRREKRRVERKRLKGLKKSRFVKFGPVEEFVLLAPTR